MSRAITSELRKLLTIRLWWVLLLSMFAYMAFLGVVLGFSLAEGSSMAGDAGFSIADIAQPVYTLATALGYVFPLVVGTLIVTNEHRHQTLTPTFLFEPRRGVVLGAKLVVAGGAGVVFGAVGTIGGIAGGLPVLAAKDVPLQLGDSDTWIAIVMSVVALALWALVGVGLGSVLPQQVAAIVTILAFTQFVEPILRLGLGSFDATDGIARFLPGAAAEAIVGSSVFTIGGTLELLTRWQGVLVMIAYVAVLTLVGRRTTWSRDIT